jgi:hypothetical protein
VAGDKASHRGDEGAGGRRVRGERAMAEAVGRGQASHGEGRGPGAGVAGGKRATAEAWRAGVRLPRPVGQRQAPLRTDADRPPPGQQGAQIGADEFTAPAG